MNKLLLFLLIFGLQCSSQPVIPIVVEPKTSAKKSFEYQQGDIIFQVSLSAQSLAIQIATNSRYSHVGILYQKNSEWYVLEAASKVKLSPLVDFINQGQNGHFMLKRLKNTDNLLDKNKLIQMKQIGEKYLGKSYDLQFLWNDDKIYCSELVWKIYQRALGVEIGKLQPLKNFNLSNNIVKNKIAQRYKGKIPMEELMISPADMFNSELLETVFEQK